MRCVTVSHKVESCCRVQEFKCSRKNLELISKVVETNDAGGKRGVSSQLEKHPISERRKLHRGCLAGSTWKAWRQETSNRCFGSWQGRPQGVRQRHSTAEGALAKEAPPPRQSLLSWAGVGRDVQNLLFEQTHTQISFCSIRQNRNDLVVFLGYF